MLVNRKDESKMLLIEGILFCQIFFILFFFFVFLFSLQDLGFSSPYLPLPLNIVWELDIMFTSVIFLDFD
jgi:hypothetical protein